MLTNPLITKPGQEFHVCNDMPHFWPPWSPPYPSRISIISWQVFLIWFSAWESGVGPIWPTPQLATSGLGRCFWCYHWVADQSSRSHPLRPPDRPRPPSSGRTQWASSEMRWESNGHPMTPLYFPIWWGRFLCLKTFKGSAHCLERVSTFWVKLVFGCLFRISARV